MFVRKCRLCQVHVLSPACWHNRPAAGVYSPEALTFLSYLFLGPDRRDPAQLSGIYWFFKKL